jgi:hypothetical protein
MLCFVCSKNVTLTRAHTHKERERKKERAYPIGLSDLLSFILSSQYKIQNIFHLLLLLLLMRIKLQRYRKQVQLGLWKTGTGLGKVPLCIWTDSSVSLQFTFDCTYEILVSVHTFTFVILISKHEKITKHKLFLSR